MSRRRLSRGVGTYALDKLVIALVQLASVPVLANAWGLALYGTWAMILTVPSFLLVADFGLTGAANARLLQLTARDDWDGARATFHTAWAAIAVLCAAIVGIGAGIVGILPFSTFPAVDSLADPDMRLTILALLAYGLLIIVCRQLATALNAGMRYSSAMLYAAGSYAFENAVVLALAWSGYGIEAAAGGLLAARLGVLAGQFALGALLVPRLRPGLSQASMAELRMLLSPAMASTAMAMGTMTYLQGTIVVLGAIAGPAAIPAFTAVRTLSRLGVQVATLISLPVSQEFAQSVARGHEQRGGKLFALVIFPAFGLAIVSGIGLALAGRSFIRLWTGGAIDAPQALLVAMAVSSFAAMFWSPLSNLIMAINRHHALSYANVLASIAGLGVTWQLSARLGSVAVGLAYVLVDAVTLAAVLAYVMRHWWPMPEFRRGIGLAAAEMRSPSALIRSLRSSEA